MNIKLNKSAVLQELARRVKENENGVRGYLESAGISVGSEGISLQQLNQLQHINPNTFAEMCRFLYPEMKDYAGADTDANAGDATAKSGSKWGAGDWIGMVGTVLNGTGVILSKFNFNGNTSAVAEANAYAAMVAQEQAAQEKRHMRNTIIIVCIGFLVIVVAGVLIFKNRK